MLMDYDIDSETSVAVALRSPSIPRRMKGVTAKTATPRLRATLLQVEGFMRQVENNPSPTRRSRARVDDSAGLSCDLQSSLTGSSYDLIAQGVDRDTGDSTCRYRTARVGLL